MCSGQLGSVTPSHRLVVRLVNRLPIRPAILFVFDPPYSAGRRAPGRRALCPAGAPSHGAHDPLFAHVRDALRPPGQFPIVIPQS